MCQCGCGETCVERAFELPDKTVVGYDVYRGCRDCFPGPGVTIFVYPDSKSGWLWHAKIEPFTPDEDGGESGHGIPISFFEVSDLIKAAKAIGGCKLSKNGYRSVDEWLEDNGLQMMQDAMILFNERMDEREKKRKAAKR